jgi:hypothetical protein
LANDDITVQDTVPPELRETLETALAEGTHALEAYIALQPPDRPIDVVAAARYLAYVVDGFLARLSVVFEDGKGVVGDTAQGCFCQLLDGLLQERGCHLGEIVHAKVVGENGGPLAKKPGEFLN